MSEKGRSFSEKFFQFLVRLLPFDFRINYQGEMEGVFREQQREASERGGFLGALRLWKETAVGIFTTAPREHWEILKADCGYALRMMRKNPGFTAIAILTLALGIGANTAIFSVVHAVLLRPLPYPDGQQLVFLRQPQKKMGIEDVTFSAREMQDYRQQSHALTGLVEFHAMSFILYGHGDPDRVRTGVVSWNYFDLFGVQPVLGRTFTTKDEQPGAPAVLLLSYEYWKNRFAADPDIAGKTFEMNDKVHTVVGVLPPVPQYPNENDVYMPTTACPFRSSKAMTENRDHRMVQAFGRMAPGVTLVQAQAELSTIATRLQAAYPDAYPETAGFATVANGLQSELTQGARPTLLLLLAAAGFVLLIACANVANLTLSRMARREREMSVRSALGAGRSRLFRQLLTESFLLALIGGALGLYFAFGSMHLLTDFAARLTPRAREIQIDSRVLLVTLVVALGTSILFGTLSALFSRVNLASSLKEGGAGTGTGRAQNRMRSGLIVCQIAFSFMLLIGAGLLLRSLLRMQQVDSGIAPQRVLVLRNTLNFSRYKTPPETLAFVEKVLDRLKVEPGVLSVAMSNRYPFEPEFLAAGPQGVSLSFQVEGRPVQPGEAPPVTTFAAVSTSYFQTLGIPLKRGRLFEENDGEPGRDVILINEAMQRRIWPNEDPVGKRVSGDGGQTWSQIVGVVGDVREFGVDRAPVPEAYAPQKSNPAPGVVLVRTVAEPLTMAKAVTAIIHGVDPQTAVTRIRTIEQARYESLANPRVTATLLGIFAALALAIASAGIGGIMALNVNQRVREIGIRVAMGAQRSSILGMVLNQGLVLTIFGIAIGVAGAIPLGRLMKSLLFETPPTDIATFAGVGATLLAAALLASFLPARRAASIDPNIALRAE